MNFQSAMQDASVALEQLDRSPEVFDAERLKPFLASEEAARGFFVVLLTGDFQSADNPPAALLQALRTAPEAALSVLTKNLVMSSATELVHAKNGDTDNAAGSRRVIERTKHLMKLINSLELKAQLKLMEATLAGDSDAYAAFLSRVNYSDEQKHAAITAIRSVLL